MDKDNVKSDFIPNSFQLPNAYSDLVMPWLTGEEWKVLTYLCRRIFGFRKQTDKVSLTQLQGGIVTGTGKVLDFGTGLSRSTVVKAIDSLIGYGIVELVTPGDMATNTPAEYALNFDTEKIKLQDLADRKQAKKARDTNRTARARASLSDRPATPSLSDRPPLVYGTDNTQSVGQTDKVLVNNIPVSKPSMGAEAPDPGTNNKIRGEKDLLDGILEYAGKAPAVDVSSYPEQVQSVILRFCELWNIKPPIKNGKKGGEFALWISDSRLLLEATAEFGLDVLKDVKAEWDKDPFITGRPGALIKLTRHVTGMKRGKLGGLNNSPDKSLSLQERRNHFRNSGSIEHGSYK